jgi:RNA polymerase sigma-70 factor (ECF subfamily)
MLKPAPLTSAGNQTPSPPSKEMVEPDDRLLALRAREGDRNAFADLVMRYSDRLQSMLQHLCGGDRDMAQELTQEAFVRAFQRLALYNGEARFYTWLYRLARNRALDILQRKRPLTGEARMGQPISQLAGPHERIERQELGAVVQRALQELPHDARELLLLREYEGWDYEHMAEALEVPIGTIKSRLARARSALRTILSGMVAAEDLV